MIWSEEFVTDLITRWLTPVPLISNIHLFLHRKFHHCVTSSVYLYGDNHICEILPLLVYSPFIQSYVQFSSPFIIDLLLIYSHFFNSICGSIPIHHCLGCVISSCLYVCVWSVINAVLNVTPACFHSHWQYHHWGLFQFLIHSNCYSIPWPFGSLFWNCVDFNITTYEALASTHQIHMILFRLKILDFR